MRDTIFLVFDQRGVRKMNKKYLPALQSGEYMVQLNVRVPDEFFQRIIPTADLTIPEDYIIAAPPIDVRTDVLEIDESEDT